MSPQYKYRNTLIKEGSILQKKKPLTAETFTFQDFFEKPKIEKMEAVAVTKYSDVLYLLEKNYILVCDTFDMINEKYKNLVFGRTTFKWNPSNYSYLEYHLHPQFNQPFFSSSVMFYPNPLMHWKKSFILLKAIYTNRFASTFFVGDRSLGSLSSIFSTFNMSNDDHFFNAFDYWFGGVLSNIRNIYSLPNNVIDLNMAPYNKQKYLSRFYIRLFRRPSCIIVLRYGGGAYHSDLECAKYRIPGISLNDTDSKVGGFSRMLYNIPTIGATNPRMIFWHLSIFVYILRHLKFKRIHSELNTLNGYLDNAAMTATTMSVPLEYKSLHLFTQEIKYLHKHNDLNKLEQRIKAFHVYRLQFKVRSKEFYSTVKHFLEVIMLTTLGLAIKGSGLLSYYFKSIFLFKNRKYTKILTILKLIFDKFSTKLQYKNETKSILYKNYFFGQAKDLRLSKVLARGSVLRSIRELTLKRYSPQNHIYILNKVFPTKRTRLIARNNSITSKKVSFVTSLKRLFFVKKKTNRIFLKMARVIKQGYFKFQLKKKLKILYPKKHAFVSGLLVPQHFVNRKIWKRLTVDQLMLKRKKALIFKPKPKKRKVFDNKKKYLKSDKQVSAVFSKQRVKKEIKKPVVVKKVKFIKMSKKQKSKPVKKKLGIKVQKPVVHKKKKIKKK